MALTIPAYPDCRHDNVILAYKEHKKNLWYPILRQTQTDIATLLIGDYYTLIRLLNPELQNTRKPFEVTKQKNDTKDTLYKETLVFLVRIFVLCCIALYFMTYFLHNMSRTLILGNSHTSFISWIVHSTRKWCKRTHTIETNG